MSFRLNNKIRKTLSRSNLIFTLTLTVILFAAIGTYLVVASQAATVLSADFNGDNTVNIYDLSVMSSNWGKTGTTHTMGDANDDDTINVFDLSILALEWGQTLAPIPIPTPIVTTTYNVKDYGALGDGAHNDVPAIKAAMTAASAAGGGTVYLPGGTYRLDTGENYDIHSGNSINLLIPSNVTITGAGISLTTVIGNLTNCSIFGADTKSKITISHMRLTAASGKTGIDGAKFSGSDNITIDDIYAQSLYIGVALYSCANSIIKNSYAEDCSAFGFCSGEADAVDNSGPNWEGIYTINVLITNCATNGCGVGFRVRGNMKSINAPYIWRSDHPIRNSGTTFSYCTDTNSSIASWYCTDGANLVIDHCSSDKTAQYSYGFYFSSVISSHITASTGYWVQDDYGNGFGACSGNVRV